MNNIFRMSVSACERWFSTVRLLMPSSRAISSLFIPDSRLILYIFCRCGGIFSTTIVTNSSSSLRWMVSSVSLLSCGGLYFSVDSSGTGVRVRCAGIPHFWKCGKDKV